MSFWTRGLGGLGINPGTFWNTNNAIGGAINEVTGATNSANTQYRNQMKLQKDAQKFAKWQMENAHQLEVQDLENAGINPIMSAGGNGATAGVTEGSASAGSASMDPISAIGNFVGMLNSSKMTKAQVENLEADNTVKNAEALKILNQTDPETQKLVGEYEFLKQQIQESKSRTDLNKAQQALAEWEGRHPILTKVLSGAPGAVGGLVSAYFMGKTMKNMNSARNAPRTTVRNTYNAKGTRVNSTVTTTR